MWLAIYTYKAKYNGSKLQLSRVPANLQLEMSQQLINRRGSSEAAIWRTPKAPPAWAGSAHRGCPPSWGDSLEDPRMHSPPKARLWRLMDATSPEPSLPAASPPPRVSSQQTALPSACPPLLTRHNTHRDHGTGSL